MHVHDANKQGDGREKTEDKDTHRAGRHRRSGALVPGVRRRRTHADEVGAVEEGGWRCAEGGWDSRVRVSPTAHYEAQ
jgi:hypothetical protein